MRRTIDAVPAAGSYRRAACKLAMDLHLVHGGKITGKALSGSALPCFPPWPQPSPSSAPARPGHRVQVHQHIVVYLRGGGKELGLLGATKRCCNGAQPKTGYNGDGTNELMSSRWYMLFNLKLIEIIRSKKNSIQVIGNSKKQQICTKQYRLKKSLDPTNISTQPWNLQSAFPMNQNSINQSIKSRMPRVQLHQ